jgi:pimeloyl-ACP methyl ester carboxylesterase
MAGDLLGRVLECPAPRGSGPRTLVVMLPGLQMKPEDFVAEGLVAAAQESGAPVDVAIPAIQADDYFEAGLPEALAEGIVEPARARGYAQIACLGISLGAMGAVRHAQRRPGDFDRLVLLAPFLGNPGTLAEVARAGGLAVWNPGALAPGDIERPALLWLKNHIRAGGSPPVHLGYGRSDRFVQASALVAELLAEGSVVTAEGAHDWPTWAVLWRLILARFPLVPRA